MTDLDDDLRAARGIMYGIPLALLLWGTIIMAGLWVFAPMAEQERDIDVVVNEWASK